MKRLCLLLVALFGLITLAACQGGNTAETTASTTVSPNTLAPSFVTGGVRYYNTGRTLAIDPGESEYSGFITSTVSMAAWPDAENQANIPVEGAPFVQQESGYALWWNEKWVLFLTLGELTR